MNKQFFISLFLFSAFLSQAQGQLQTAPQMADRFREDGKIYVVIAVIAIVFLAIVGFLIYLERKIKKLEKAVKKN